MKKIIILAIILVLVSGCVPTFSDIKEKLPGQNRIHNNKKTTKTRIQHQKLYRTTYKKTILTSKRTIQTRIGV